MSAETNLILDISGFPPESARNCTQELKPIANGEFKRSVNGDLMFLETTERKKYHSVISCTDINTPIVDRLWIGSQLSVGCIQNLWQSIAPQQTKITLIRPAVAGSVSVVNNFGEQIPFRQVDNNIELYKPYDEKIFVSFRPWLTMQVINFSMTTKEWDMEGGWRLELEEI